MFYQNSSAFFILRSHLTCTALNLHTFKFFTNVQKVQDPLLIHLCKYYTTLKNNFKNYMRLSSTVNIVCKTFDSHKRNVNFEDVHSGLKNLPGNTVDHINSECSENLSLGKLNLNLKSVNPVLKCYTDKLEIVYKKHENINEDNKQILFESHGIIWRKQNYNLIKLLQSYKKLSKIRLTGLVIATSIAGYLLAPDAFQANLFLWSSIGIGLTACSASSFNQFLEVPFDSQMIRTQHRALVQGSLSPLHALLFGIITGLSGITILFTQVNSLCGILGILNLVLYSFVYTPLKRITIFNTWIGSVVGAIPPVIGWVACTGNLNIGAVLPALILYFWQFFHFNSLSWNLRAEYSKAGYRMMSVCNPDLCKRTTLRYSIALLAICLVAPLMDVTTWTFVFDSLPLNLYLLHLSVQFYTRFDSSSSRKLFQYSLVYLPTLLMLMIISKAPY